MNPTLGAYGFGLLLVIACLFGAASWRRDKRRLAFRIEEARGRAVGLRPVRKIESGIRFTGAVAAFGSAIASSGIVPTRTLMELERTLQAGGFTASNGVGLLIGSKIVLGVVMTGAAMLALRGVAIRPLFHFVIIAGAGLGGLMSPDLIIQRMRKSYLAAVERGLADGLDMMVICAEAGLALEAAIQRVSVEIVHAHPKLAGELAITSNELRLVADSRIGLLNLGTRTGLVSLKRLGGTLVQSIQYGTPLSSALRTLASELRQETLTRFEERAARLPVLLTIPMILFILPCVFLVVAGPIAVQVLKTMKH